MDVPMGDSALGAKREGADFLESLQKFNEQQIAQAGARYTPGIDPNAPNLRIESIATAVECMACGEEASKRLAGFLSAFDEQWGRAKTYSQNQAKIQSAYDDALSTVPNLVSRIRGGDEKAASWWVNFIEVLNAQLQMDYDFWRQQETSLPPEERGKEYLSIVNSIRGTRAAIGSCQRVVSEEKEFITSSSFKLLSNPLLLITGQWGTGKTHLMCDMTKVRGASGKATLLILAKNFQGNVLKEVGSTISVNLEMSQVIENLQKVAEATGDRAIIIVDGINEGVRKDWLCAASELLELVDGRTGVGLVLTCRTPFEEVSVPDRKKFHEVKHVGFQEMEFDAQAAFFDYYKLPLPEVPLLEEEFSRPLTLKLICESLKNLSGKKRQQGFAGIASGQKGMTYVLESFVKIVGAPIEAKFGLNSNGCWWLLKGGNKIQDKRHSGFAACMAQTGRGYVLRSQADKIIAANYPNFGLAKRKRLLEDLRTHGLLEEDVVWYRAGTGGVKSRIVFRLPYQRFSDHLIARHLLDSYLDKTDEASIKRSFRSSAPLGRIFRSHRYGGRQFSEPGLAQALIAEYPERVKKIIPDERCELVFALGDTKGNMHLYIDPFIEGLFWRAPSSFTEGTRVVINLCLNAGQANWDKIIDSLVAVSIKEGHPFNAERIYKSISTWSMVDRDLTWSEYVRRRYASPTIARLLEWVRGLTTISLSEDVAKQLVHLFSLVLTAVDRDARDLATKALVLIGERHPSVLFDHALKSLAFNDAYVPERVMAAAYGITMSCVDSASAATFRSLLGGFAEKLYRSIFSKDGEFRTHHALVRDHAAGIIDLAMRAGLFKKAAIVKRNLRPPYPQIPTRFTGPCAPDQSVKDAVGYAIRMDFENYTVGRLIPGRANYDDKHPEYIRVLSHIERRILELGYTKEKFSDIDGEIQGTHYHGRSGEASVNRYGKKYSWIAYYEMWGERQALGLLDSDRSRERTPDCGVDPSFPKEPPIWNAPIPDLFGGYSGDIGAWVEGGFLPEWRSLLEIDEINGLTGPWVLLNGFVRGVSDDKNVEIFSFLHGVFVKRSDVPNLNEKFFASDYPGNSQIQDAINVYYLYAGEAGRSPRYVPDLLCANGQYKRQMGVAFETYYPKRLAGVNIEIPYINYSWESYHSSLNKFSGFYFPSPSIIQKLGLSSRDREVDFYDAEGRPATLYREAGEEYQFNRFQLLYIQSDLLRKYLNDTCQDLAWCIWGERDWHVKGGGSRIHENPERVSIVQRYKNIHRYYDWWG
ncbi:MAG TPA: hypothetical protein VGE64_07120 [Xanthomonadaceae bacterium]